MIDEEACKKIHEELISMSAGNEFFWDDDNYSIVYDFAYENIMILRSSRIFNPTVVYFRSEEDARNAIRKIGRDVLIEKYFDEDPYASIKLVDGLQV